jgi:hypothetical protein
VEVVAVGPWEWGWEAFVAIGTVLLAAATVGLAWSTRGLAKASEAELRAQWRPVILPALDPLSRRAITYDGQEGLLHVRVRNAGRGPAHHVRVTIDPLQVSPEHWSLGALAVGDEQGLRFRTAKIESTIQLLVDYRDLADRTYATSITVTAVNEDLRFYDVHLFDHPVTQLGDAIYPQPGLRDVRRPPARRLRVRLRRQR